MGYIRHHAIAVTTYTLERTVTARDEALRIFGDRLVTAIQISPANGYHTFFVGPDGSKEGWEVSDEGDTQRDEFINWLVGEHFENGNNPYDWVEVQYGDDGGKQKVTRANDLAPDYIWNPGKERK